jgi:hypothetical protein
MQPVGKSQQPVYDTAGDFSAGVRNKFPPTRRADTYRYHKQGIVATDKEEITVYPGISLHPEGKTLARGGAMKHLLSPLRYEAGQQDGAIGKIKQQFFRVFPDLQA